MATTIVFICESIKIRRMRYREVNEVSKDSNCTLTELECNVPHCVRVGKITMKASSLNYFGNIFWNST